jgi:hypothetical protein
MDKRKTARAVGQDFTAWIDRVANDVSAMDLTIHNVDAEHFSNLPEGTRVYIHNHGPDAYLVGHIDVRHYMEQDGDFPGQHKAYISLFSKHFDSRPKGER